MTRLSKSRVQVQLGFVRRNIIFLPIRNNEFYVAYLKSNRFKKKKNGLSDQGSNLQILVEGQEVGKQLITMKNVFGRTRSIKLR